MVWAKSIRSYITIVNELPSQSRISMQAEYGTYGHIRAIKGKYDQIMINRGKYMYSKLGINMENNDIIYVKALYMLCLSLNDTCFHISDMLKVMSNI